MTIEQLEKGNYQRQIVEALESDLKQLDLILDSIAASEKRSLSDFGSALHASINPQSSFNPLPRHETKVHVLTGIKKYEINVSSNVLKVLLGGERERIVILLNEEKTKFQMI